MGTPSSAPHRPLRPAAGARPPLAAHRRRHARGAARAAAELGLPALALTDVDTLAGVVDVLRAAERAGVRPIVGAELSDPAGRAGAPGRAGRGRARLAQPVQARLRASARRRPRRPGRAPGGPVATSTSPRSAARFREGLVFLVDHPRLLVALHGRVEPERAASRRSRPRRCARGRARARAQCGRPASGAGGGRATPAPRARRETSTPPKTPPAARPGAASSSPPRARSASPPWPCPTCGTRAPSGVRDHRVRVAVKHNALARRSARGVAGRRAGAPAGVSTSCAPLYADLPDVPGPFRRRAARTARRRPASRARCSSPSAAPTRRRSAACSSPRSRSGQDETPWSLLYRLAFEGATRRYRPLRPEVVRRLDYELGTIERLGFAAYFLLVKQIADFARARGIPCVGRGSAADSLVAYCLELTDADPLRYRLPFERFLNPARRDRPDIDLDFCWRRRDEVIEHVYQAFGSRAHGDDRDAGHLRPALGLPRGGAGARASRRPRSTAGRDGCRCGRVQRAPTPTARPRTAVRCGDTRARRGNVVARALRAHARVPRLPLRRRALAARPAPRPQRLLGAPRHFGLHPGGVVVAPGADHRRRLLPRAAKGVVVTAVRQGRGRGDRAGQDGPARQPRADRARRLRAASWRGAASPSTWPRLPEDDPATARLLREGRTLGCFQIESPGMRNLLQQTGAADMDAVIQAVALIRPGPGRLGHEGRLRAPLPRPRAAPRRRTRAWPSCSGTPTA